MCIETENLKLLRKQLELRTLTAFKNCSSWNFETLVSVDVKICDRLEKSENARVSSLNWKYSNMTAFENCQGWNFGVLWKTLV